MAERPGGYVASRRPTKNGGCERDRLGGVCLVGCIPTRRCCNAEVLSLAQRGEEFGLQIRVDRRLPQAQVRSRQVANLAQGVSRISCARIDITVVAGAAQLRSAAQVEVHHWWGAARVLGTAYHRRRAPPAGSYCRPQRVWTSYRRYNLRPPQKAVIIGRGRLAWNSPNIYHIWNARYADRNATDAGAARRPRHR